MRKIAVGGVTMWGSVGDLAGQNPHYPQMRPDRGASCKQGYSVGYVLSYSYVGLTKLCNSLRVQLALSVVGWNPKITFGLLFPLRSLKMNTVGSGRRSTRGAFRSCFKHVTLRSHLPFFFLSFFSPFCFLPCLKHIPFLPFLLYLFSTLFPSFPYKITSLSRLQRAHV